MLANITYCPVLYARVAEMKALAQLPAATKNLMFPLFNARPWPNANRLEHTWKKVSDAFGERRFALDLDGFKRYSSTGKIAADEFDALFEVEDGFSNYYKLIASLQWAIPVIQMAGGQVVSLQRQIEHARELDRGLVLRLRHDMGTRAVNTVQEVLGHLDETIVFVDAGWDRDLLSREMWASAVIQAVTDLQPETELVVAGSSFPDSFTNIGERKEFAARERFLHDALVRRHNAAVITYGDWGSSRVPMLPTPMVNVPRIDLPMPSEWISFRRVEDEDYPDIARRVVADSLWPRDLNIWGTYAIASTADDLPSAIRGPAAATAARINIHLHRQAHFGAVTAANEGDEPYTDD